MPRITESVHIERPIEAVWDFVADVANTPVWNPMWEHQEVVGGGSLELGARFLNVTRMMGRRIEAEAEITSWEPPRRSTVRAVTGPIEATGSYVLEPEGAGTRFTWQLDAASGLGGQFGRLADSLVMRVSARNLRAGLEGLRTILEEQVEDEVSRPS